MWQGGAECGPTRDEDDDGVRQLWWVPWWVSWEVQIQALPGLTRTAARRGTMSLVPVNNNSSSSYSGSSCSSSSSYQHPYLAPIK